MEHEIDVAIMAAAERDARHTPGADRRMEGERRRSPRGWLEMRARRDGIEVDRRRPVRRQEGWARTLLPFWGRSKA